MNEVETTYLLSPSLSGAFARVLFFSLINSAIYALLSHQPIISVWLSYGAPLLLVAAAICCFMIPQRIEWSESGMVIQTRFRGRRSFDWDQLYAYGPVKGGFDLKFNGATFYLIYSCAFDPEQWREFEEFLSTNYPEKKNRR